MAFRILIRGIGSLSSLGASRSSIEKAYEKQTPSVEVRGVGGEAYPCYALTKEGEARLEEVRSLSPHYQFLDRTALLAIAAARSAVKEAGWEESLDPVQTGVGIGSARGATLTFESRFTQFLREGQKGVEPSVSPLTTAGNLSSFVAQDLLLDGIEVSHSVTCTSSLHSIVTGFMWLKGGFSRYFLAGGSEAPLSPFTIAQMRALRIYSTESNSTFPCQPFSLNKKNTFTLGEGACVFALEGAPALEKRKKEESKVEIEILSFGVALEKMGSKTGISSEGEALSRSMNRALANIEGEKEIDVIILHAPGTVKGDQAELNAVESLFKEKIPFLFSSKYLLGHTLGASGGLSLEYALYLLEGKTPLDIPYPTTLKERAPSTPIKRVMVNATGFGGNAVSIVVGLSQ